MSRHGQLTSHPFPIRIAAIGGQNDAGHVDRYCIHTDLDFGRESAGHGLAEVLNVGVRFDVLHGVVGRGVELEGTRVERQLDLAKVHQHLLHIVDFLSLKFIGIQLKLVLSTTGVVDGGRKVVLFLLVEMEIPDEFSLIN